jgi:RHS repeat-associated protein
LLVRGGLRDTYSYGLLAQPGGSVGCAVTTPGSKPIGKPARPLFSDQRVNPGSGRRILPPNQGQLRHHASYDATGLRRSKQDASGTTRFLWDGQTLLLEADAGGTTQAHYTAAPRGYGPLVAQRRGTTSRFYHPADLGTIENLTDASGNVTDSYVLDAWGREIASSGSTVNPHRYVGSLGYQTDPALGLTYVRARYLRPSTGSWLSVDPVLGEPRYLYVGSSPVQRVDPGGRRGGRVVLPDPIHVGTIIDPTTGEPVPGNMSRDFANKLAGLGDCITPGNGWPNVSAVIDAILRESISVHPGMSTEDILNNPDFWKLVVEKLTSLCEEAKRARAPKPRPKPRPSGQHTCLIPLPPGYYIITDGYCPDPPTGGGGDDGGTEPVYCPGGESGPIEGSQLGGTRCPPTGNGQSSPGSGLPDALPGINEAMKGARESLGYPSTVPPGHLVDPRLQGPKPYQFGYGYQ